MWTRGVVLFVDKGWTFSFFDPDGNPHTYNGPIPFSRAKLAKDYMAQLLKALNGR